jgi:hypothetical protein
MAEKKLDFQIYIPGIGEGMYDRRRGLSGLRGTVLRGSVPLLTAGGQGLGTAWWTRWLQVQKLGRHLLVGT